jgi:trk system potassium uptake protein TrkH
VQDGGVVVLLSWVLVTLASSAPFMFVLDLSFTQSVFESVSGWTTTGLSVVDVESAPKTILLWRGVMQLAGGAGIAIILTTVAGGNPGTGITTAEGRTDQLVAHVKRSARLVLTIYAGYALLCSLALVVAGMSWFDAVNHAFAAVSTGGFSTRAASLGYWNSPTIEAVTILFMVLGATNFQTVNMALHGRFGAVLRNGEVKTAAVMAALAIPLTVGFATSALYVGGGRQLRVAVFETVTALTTTGFSTSEGAVYRGWPTLGIALLIPLMLVGGGTGSTAGGIKQQRAYLLACAVRWELRRLFAPARAVIDTSVWQGDGRVTIADRGVVQTAVFTFTYLTIFAVGAGILMACGYGLQESLFEYASALGTVGLSVGVTSASAPVPVLWAEIVGMFLGRLEIFIVLIALRKLVADGASLLGAGRR